MTNDTEKTLKGEVTISDKISIELNECACKSIDGAHYRTNNGAIEDAIELLVGEKTENQEMTRGVNFGE